MTTRKVLVLCTFLGLLLAIQPLARADVVATITYGGQSSQPIGSQFYQIGQYVYQLNPYAVTISIDGFDTPGFLLSCDDYAGNINGAGDTWDATVQTLASLAPAWDTQKFLPPAVNPPYTIPEEYYAAALLSTDIYTLSQSGWNLNGLTSSDPGYFLGTGLTAQQAAIVYSYALWELFSTAPDGDFDPTLYGISQDQVTQLMDNYLNEVSGNNIINVPDVIIYTPTADFSGEQEFIGLGLGDSIPVRSGLKVPEGSGGVILAFDLFVLFVGIFLVRKRILAR